MIRPRNFDRSEILNIADSMKELMDVDNLLDDILCWFSTDDIADCLYDIARTYDIHEQVFPND